MSTETGDEYVELTDEEQKNIRRARIKTLEYLNAPQIVIDHEKRLLNMTPQEIKEEIAIQNETFELERIEYLKEHPPKEEIAKKIFEKFNLWFEKYKNDPEYLKYELDTGHCFKEPWFWGSIPCKSEKEFYEHILTEEEFDMKNYDSVFSECYAKIIDRLNK